MEVQEAQPGRNNYLYCVRRWNRDKETDKFAGNEGDAVVQADPTDTGIGQNQWGQGG